MFNNIEKIQGNFNDFSAFAQSTHLYDYCVRYWYKKEEDSAANYGFIVTSIILPDNDVLLGIRGYDSKEPDYKYKGITFVRLSDLDEISIYQNDQEEEEEEC